MSSVEPPIPKNKLTERRTGWMKGVGLKGGDDNLLLEKSPPEQSRRNPTGRAEVNTPLSKGNGGSVETTWHASCTKCSAEQVHTCSFEGNEPNTSINPDNESLDHISVFQAEPEPLLTGVSEDEDDITYYMNGTSSGFTVSVAKDEEQKATVETENTFTDYKNWWNEVVHGHSPTKTEETYSRKEHGSEEPIIKNAKINTPLSEGNTGLVETTKGPASCTKCSDEQVHICSFEDNEPNASIHPDDKYLEHISLCPAKPELLSDTEEVSSMDSSHDEGDKNMTEKKQRMYLSAEERNRSRRKNPDPDVSEDEDVTYYMNGTSSGFTVRVGLKGGGRGRPKKYATDDERKAAAAERKRAARQLLSPSQKKIKAEEHAKRMKTHRDSFSPTRKKMQAEDDAKRMKTHRDSLSPTRKEKLAEEEATRKREHRQRDPFQHARKNILEKCFLSYICVSDCMLRTRDAVSEVKLDGLRPTFTESQLAKLTINPSTRSSDGKFYICFSCKKTIKRGGWPRLNEKHIDLAVAPLPANLREKEMALNKCESYLLKLNIPFIRVAHLPRSADFKVIGPMIVVEGKVEETMDNLLPRPQRLIPVALKRKMEYAGSFVSEIVDIEKLMAYYKHFKQVNHLFKDTEMSNDKLDDFFLENLQSIAEQDDKKVRHDQDEQFEEVKCNDKGLPYDVKEEGVDENLPIHLSEIPMDSLVCPNIGQREGKGTLTELIANSIVHLDKELKTDVLEEQGKGGNNDSSSSSEY